MNFYRVARRHQERARWTDGSMLKVLIAAVTLLLSSIDQHKLLVYVEEAADADQE